MNPLQPPITIIIVFIIIQLTLNQKANGQGIIKQMGFKSGLNVSHMSNTDDDIPRVRFNLGAYYRMPISKRFYFVPELLFQARGAKIEPDFSEPAPNVNILSLDTPALIRYTFRSQNGWMVTSGPNVSFAFRTRVNNDRSGDDRLSASISEIINTVTFGWIGEVGYKWPSSITKGSFLVTMRYKRGITSQFVDDPDNTINDIFSVNLGFEF